MDNAQSAFQYFVGQGLSPVQAAGIVGNLQGESGQGLNTGSVSRGDGSDGSDSIGIAQWNGARAQALKDYAASKNVPWTDLGTQLEFLHSELKGPESAAYKNLQGAQTTDQAAQAMLGFERPKDWDKPGSHPERYKNAAAILSAYGNGAPESPASPAIAPPQGRAPVFPQQQASAAPQIPMPQVVADSGTANYFAQTPATQIQTPPIYYAPRRAPDLSALRASLAARAPIFPSQG